MMTAVTSALSSVISSIGSIVSAIVTPAVGTTPAGALHELLPLLAIGVSISLFFCGIKALKSIIWGA